MRDDDLEERLRRALHVQLDGTEPPATDRRPRARHGAGVPFGLLAAATSVVLVALLVGPRLAGPGGTPAGGSPALAAAGVSSTAGVSSEAPGAAPSGPSTPAAIPPAGSAGSPGPSPSPVAVSPSGTEHPTPTKTPTATVQAVPPPVAVTMPPAPTATPTPVPQSASGTVVVTLAQVGQTIDLAVGQQLVLQLGSTYQWTVQVSGSGVLAPTSVPSQAGQQGAWIAERAGTAQLQVIGNPFCLQLKPPCGMPSRAFTVTVVVR